MRAQCNLLGVGLLSPLIFFAGSYWGAVRWNEFSKAICEWGSSVPELRFPYFYLLFISTYYSATSYLEAFIWGRQNALCPFYILNNISKAELTFQEAHCRYQFYSGTFLQAKMGLGRKRICDVVFGCHGLLNQNLIPILLFWVLDVTDHSGHIDFQMSRLGVQRLE